jgi:hypothetical protein
MTVSRLHPSHRTHHIIRSLSTFSRQYCLARPRSYNDCHVGARSRGTKRLVLRGRGFHHSSMNKEPQEQVDYYKIMKLPQNATELQIKHSYFKVCSFTIIHLYPPFWSSVTINGSFHFSFHPNPRSITSTALIYYHPRMNSYLRHSIRM